LHDEEKTKNPVTATAQHIDGRRRLRSYEWFVMKKMSEQVPAYLTAFSCSFNFEQAFGFRFVIGLPPPVVMTSQAMAVGAVAGAIATATLARSSSGVFHVADDDTSSSSTKTNGSPTKTNGSHSYQRDKLAKSI
jgi:hypothetical protein